MNENAGRDKVNEVKIDTDSSSGVGNNAWLEALRELEGFAPAAAPVRPATPIVAKAPVAPLRRPVAAAPARPAAKPDPVALMETILGRLDSTRQELAAFVAKHPCLIAPNIHNMLDDHLKETAFTMGREKKRAEGNCSSDGGVS